MSTTPNPQTGSTYIGLLLEVWPLMLVAFIIALAQGWRGIQHSYRHRNVAETVTNVVLSSAAMSLISVGTAWLLPIVGIDTSGDPSLFVGVVVMVSAVGMKGLDAVMRKIAGFSVFDPHDVEQVREVYERMTPAQREKHMRNCPFYASCGYCQLHRDDSSK